MSAGHIAALVLLIAGTGALVVSAVAIAVLPAPYTRLHALSPAASLGAPLVGLACAVETGPGRSAVKIVIIAVLLAVAGPVTTMATGRTAVRGGRGARGRP